MFMDYLKGIKHYTGKLMLIILPLMKNTYETYNGIYMAIVFWPYTKNGSTGIWWDKQLY